jgi:hypothetical protein
MLKQIIWFPSVQRPFLCTNCIQSEPDIVVLIGPFFTLNSYIFLYAGTVQIFEFVQHYWAKAVNCKGTIYINTQMLQGYRTIYINNVANENWKKYYGNYHIIYKLWSHVNAKHNAARCAIWTINATTYLAHCHSCKSQWRIWWPAIHNNQVSNQIYTNYFTHREISHRRVSWYVRWI